MTFFSALLTLSRPGHACGSCRGKLAPSSCLVNKEFAGEDGAELSSQTSYQAHRKFTFPLRPKIDHSVFGR